MLTIAWDVDDVLNDLLRAFLEEWWLPAHPECNLTYLDLIENTPQNVLGVNLDVYRASLDAFRLSEKANYLQVNAEVMAWFEQHGSKAHHIALTATALTTAGASAGWVMGNFGKWIRSYHIVPSPRIGLDSPVYDQKKIDFLRRIGNVDVFLDDAPLNLAGIEELGIKPILIARPWNSGGLTMTKALERLTELVMG